MIVGDFEEDSREFALEMFESTLAMLASDWVETSQTQESRYHEIDTLCKLFLLENHANIIAQDDSWY